MRKFLILVILLALSWNVPLYSYYFSGALVQHAIKSSTNTTSATTVAADFSAANFIFVCAADYGGDAASVITSSPANTWVDLTEYKDGSNVTRIRGHYVFNPTVSGTMTFTATGTQPSIAVLGFSGVATSPLDQQNGNGATSTTVATGSITPGQDNEVIASCGGFTPTGSPPTTLTVNSGMTLRDQVDSVGSTSFGLGSGYKIQTSLAAINVTWDANGNNQFFAADVISFKTAAAATARRGMLMGIFP